MAAFFAVFLVAGLGFLLVFLLPAIQAAKARSWPAVECEVLESSVAGHSGSDGTTYSIEVRYRYTWDGVEYVGDRYEFLGGSSSGRASKQEVVDGLPAGTTTTCWVDPREPSSAVMHRGLSWVYLFALLPLVFVAVGGGGMVWALTAGRTAARSGTVASARSSPEGAPAATAFREVDAWSTPLAAAGPVELEEKLSPVGKLVATTVIAVFWNGIVAVFVWQLWQGWRAGGGIDGCLAAFLVPFVLVGLLLLVGVPYQLLALANPRPRLTLSRAGVPLGGSAQLDWRFRGSAGRLGSLRIVLEGAEQARYRRGTTTHTDTEVFARIPVVDRGAGAPLATGGATIEVPEDTMHSFEGDNNKIVWTLKVHGSIAFWPDVSAEFPFVVTPGEGRGDGRG